MVNTKQDDISTMSELCQALEATDKLDRESVETILRRYKSDDYKKWMKTDFEGRYHRGEVCSGGNGKFCVLVHYHVIIIFSIFYLLVVYLR